MLAEDCTSESIRSGKRMIRLTTLVVIFVVFFAPCAYGQNRPLDKPVDTSQSLSFLLPRHFSWQAFSSPEPIFYPAYFWLWNGALKPEVIRRQLRDMAGQGAKNVCVLPEPREFRPATLNNQMDVDYLSPEYFDRVRYAVDEASSLNMHYWLYDEGGWPSGSASGRVVQERPGSIGKLLVYNGDGSWSHARGGTDLLDPLTTKTFIALTHRQYAESVGNHFGKTIKMTFTDEPAYHFPKPGSRIPWTANANLEFRNHFGYSLEDNLDAFAVAHPLNLTEAEKKVRVDAFDFWSSRFRDSYLKPIRDWGRENGLASSGHLGGEDETSGAISYGYGSIMRQLRAMDVPGVDAILQQIFPGKKTENNFPKFASSVAHQNGSALVVSESFCVYGNGLTPAQMKWVTDYERARGVTMQIFGCYPLSTKDHLMQGERPHFGPVNPLWEFLSDLHLYSARLNQVLACGQPVIDTALYYPVRDMWANGIPDDPAIAGFNQLTHELLERQCDYDFIDDDILNDSNVEIVGERLVLGAMSYRTVVVGPNKWMTKSARAQLVEFENSGGQVIWIENNDGIASAVANIPPTVELTHASPQIRVLQRQWVGGGAVFLFNEGLSPYEGTATLNMTGSFVELDPISGKAQMLPFERLSNGKSQFSFVLAPAESKLVVSLSPEYLPKDLPPPSKLQPAGSIKLTDGWTARVDARYVVGEHDFEIHSFPQARFEPVELGPWATTLGLGPDFSGHVTYTKEVSVPESYRNGKLVLEINGLNSAAIVMVNGEQVGSVLWSPWRIELPSIGESNHFALSLKVSNTLANELTSKKVRDLWTTKTGPGWPGDYNSKAWAFETESRGGGLVGPVSLQFLSMGGEQ